MSQPPAQEHISFFEITQATAAAFPDLYFTRSTLIFIQQGSKRVVCPHKGEMVGEAGDLIIFPPGVLNVIENKPVMNGNYKATGVCFSDDLIHRVYNQDAPLKPSKGVELIRADDHAPREVLKILLETHEKADLPAVIQDHRLLEPLIWLKAKGYTLPASDLQSPMAQVRELIETDIAFAWKISHIARHFAMSESSLRRWLSKDGYGFAKILLNTRLEHGLAMLQTSREPISQIALSCGFNTPSHFSDAFKKRFNISPKKIRSQDI